MATGVTFIPNPPEEQSGCWLEAQFSERKTEPSSGLGKAIQCLLRQLARLLTELIACPAEWMPWNYRETLTRTVPSSDFASHSMC